MHDEYLQISAFSMICREPLRDPASTIIPTAPSWSFPAYNYVMRVAVLFDILFNATFISESLLMKDLTSFLPWWLDSGKNTSNSGMMILSLKQES